MNARRHFEGCTDKREGETLILTNILLFSKAGKPCVHQETWEVLTANILLIIKRTSQIKQSDWFLAVIY